MSDNSSTVRHIHIVLIRNERRAHICYSYLYAARSASVADETSLVYLGHLKASWIRFCREHSFPTSVVILQEAMRRLFVKMSLQTCGSITNANGLMSFPRAALQQAVENEACLLYKMRSLHAGFEERKVGNRTPP